MIVGFLAKDLTYNNGRSNKKTCWEEIGCEKDLKGDLTLLKGMENLSTLGLTKCTLKNPEAIVSLPNLKYLYIQKTEGIDDLSIFKDLPKIAEANVYYDKDKYPQEQVDALKKAKEEAKKKQ